MPRKPKAQPAALPAIPAELVEQLVKGPMTVEAVQDLSMAFKKALIERALGAEPGHHLDYPPSGAYNFGAFKTLRPNSGRIQKITPYQGSPLCRPHTIRPRDALPDTKKTASMRTDAYFWRRSWLYH